LTAITSTTPRRRPLGRVLGHALEPWLYLSPALVVLGVCLLVPLVLGLSYAFQDFGPFRSTWSGTKNFEQLIADRTFWHALVNTVWWTAASLFFQFFLGLGLAMLLNTRFVGKRLVQAVVFLPWAVPSFLSGLTGPGFSTR
jgi:multiple sugar transport system permease protein